MGTIIKHTLRNIFAKPLITIFLILSITVCAFTGILALDISNSITNVIKSLMTEETGKAEIMYYASDSVEEDDLADIPEHEAVLLSSKSSSMCVKNDNMYEYYNQKSLVTYCTDINTAIDYKILAKDIVLNDDECVITDKIAEDMGLKEGDTFTIFGDNDIDADFKIKKIIKPAGLLSGQYSALVTENGMAKLTFDGKVKYSTAYIKMQDPSKCSEAVEILEKKDPTGDVVDILNGQDFKSTLATITSIFLGLFLITLLLVIFVTISLSERIILERMSTVGTLRSLGVSPAITTRVILVENLFYGLFGGIFGTLAYALIRDPFFNSIFNVTTASGIEFTLDLGKISPVAIATVIVGAIVVEMLCPLKELLKATKRPIRDIIFDNKETDYKFKNKYKYISIILGIISVVLFVVGTVYIKSGFICLLGFTFVVIAGYMGYPFILRGIGSLIERRAFSKGKPIVGLAATNLRSKKTSIGSSRLIFIATAVCVCLFTYIISEYNFIIFRPADADIVVSGLTKGKETYEFYNTLEGVTDVEFIYNVAVDSVVAGTKEIDNYLEKKYEENSSDLLKKIGIYGADGKYKLFKNVSGIPDEIKSDEIYITKTLADEFNVKKGDNLDILLKGDGAIPFRETYKVAGYIDSSKEDASNRTILMNMDNYKRIYFDSPSRAYIKSTDPARTKDLIESYSSNRISYVKTMDEYIDDVIDQSKGEFALLGMIMVMGVGLALIGVICNQIVAFENRKRESAVLVSTSMNRKKLIKLFMLENTFSSILAIVFGLAIGLVLTKLLFGALASMIQMEIVIDYAKTGLLLLGMFVAFSITILKTRKNIKKMKLSEQLKYE